MPPVVHRNVGACVVPTGYESAGLRVGGREGGDYVCVLPSPTTHSPMPPLSSNQFAHVVNLPCVVEVHKTVDNATLFKSGDVGQMVVVYGTQGRNDCLYCVA